MLVTLEKVLTPDELQSIRTALAGAVFVDGKMTAGPAIRHLKNNLQLPRSNNPSNLDNLVMAAFSRHAIFTSLTLPRRFLLPLFSKYEPGMSYGWHVDAGIIGEQNPIRADVSCTVFINDPADYDGGELEIQSAGGTVNVKLPAGQAVIYESTTLHRVRPVTRGARLVAVTWIESLVPSEAIRQILYDIAQVRNSLVQQAPDSGEAMLLSKSYANLLRMFAAT